MRAIKMARLPKYALFKISAENKATTIKVERVEDKLSMLELISQWMVIAGIFLMVNGFLLFLLTM